MQGVQHLVPPPTGQVVFTAGIVLDIAKVQRCPKDDRVPGLQLGCQFGFLGTVQIISAAAAALHSQVGVRRLHNRPRKAVVAGFGAAIVQVRIAHINLVGVCAVPLGAARQIVVGQFALIRGKAQVVQHFATAGNFAAVGQLRVLQDLGNWQQDGCHKSASQSYDYFRFDCTRFHRERKAAVSAQSVIIYR